MNGVLPCKTVVALRSSDLPPSLGRYKDSGRPRGTSPRLVPIVGKGKGKATTSPELPPPVEEGGYPPSLEALMADLTMFEELLLKDPEEEVISWLVSVYGKVVMKKVQDLLMDYTPFQMAATVILCLYFMFSFMSFLFFVVDRYYVR